MLLLRVTLNDFRNVELASTELGPQFTVLHGRNGAGKTNFLEAIYLVSTLRSFRTTETRAMVRRERSAARVELDVHDTGAGLPARLAVRLESGARSMRRTAWAEGKLVRSAADFYGRIRAILFTPEDLGVLRGGPTGRRQMLDRVLFSRERAHIEDVQRYDKLVRSRNRVLRREPPLTPQEQGRLLETYEEALAEVGGRIWTRRSRVVETLGPGFRASFESVQGSGAGCAMRYVSRLEQDVGPVALEDRPAALALALRASRVRDEQRGSTGVGPHRDDLLLELDGVPAATYASQGQSRSLILAFKIAELESARERWGHAPLLLLDDVSSELDPGRSAQLFEALGRGAAQCLLTTTAPHFISLARDVERKDIEVSAGRLLPG